MESEHSVDLSPAVARTDDQVEANLLSGGIETEQRRRSGSLVSTSGNGRSERALLGSVGTRLREWRIRRGLTQSAVALDSGLDQSSVSNYESGKRDIPLSAMLRLMATLNVSLGDLVDLSTLPHGDEEVIVARNGLLGEAVSRLMAGRPDVARASVELEIAWLVSRETRAAIALAAENGTDVVTAAFEAIEHALAVAAEHDIDRCEMVAAAARSAIAEAALISEGAARRVREALERRGREGLERPNSID